MTSTQPDTSGAQSEFSGVAHGSWTMPYEEPSITEQPQEEAQTNDPVKDEDHD